MTPTEAADAAWAEVTARHPLPTGPAVIRDLDDFTDWCRAIGGQRIAWMERHKPDLRAAYRRHLAGEPAPDHQLALEIPPDDHH